MTTTPAADIKAKHRTMWALGDYARIADRLIPSLGPVLVEAAGVTAGQHVLDVAAGTGNAAIPAARTGAEVVASDLTPELLETGRHLADAAGAEVSWEVGDAEALPYDDAAFDTVLSCVGVMFAPFHAAAARELLWVTRPGGTIGLLNWTPQGFIGQMFATLKPFAPPPPEGAQPPPLWGDEEHVTGLLGGGADIRTERRRLAVDGFGSGAELRDFFKACYGPTIVVYRSLGEDAARVAELDAALADLGDRSLQEGDGTSHWEYLLVTATRHE